MDIGSRRRARPLLPSYFGLNKRELERRIVTKRERDNADRLNWQGYSGYVNKEYNESYYQSRWSRPSTASDAHKIQEKQFPPKFQKVKNALFARKAKLAEILRQEAENYNDEIKKKSQSGKSEDIQSIMDKVEKLKEQKEATRRASVRDKKLEMWRRDNPRVRSAHVERRRREMVDLWTGQLDEKQEKQRLKEEQREKDKIKADQDAEDARLIEKLALEKRRRAQEEMAAQLAAQMRELQEKEAEQNRLKNEERQLVQNQNMIDLEEQKQREKMKRKNQSEQRKILYRQYRAQLLRRAHEIEEDLEADLAMLERVKREEEEENRLQAEKASDARLVAEEAIELLRLKLKEEKQAQAEIERLYRDQAEEWWAKRQKEWDSEKSARQHLLKDVLDARREQVAKKLEQNRLSQHGVLEERQNLIKQIETDRQTAATERQKVEEKRIALVDGLRAQVEAKNEITRQEIDQKEKENLDHLITQRQLEDLEIEEAEQILDQPTQPRQTWR